MMILKSIYIWVSSLLYLAIRSRFPEKKTRHNQWAVRNLNPQKEYSWLEIQRKHIPMVNVVIGPYLGWPEVQQIFRFVRQYAIPTIVTIDGKDETWEGEGHQFINSLRDWIINLMNRFEIPNEVFVFQILDRDFSPKKLSYMFLLEACMSIDQSLLNAVNRGKLIESTVGNRICNDLALKLLLMNRLKNYFFNLSIDAIPRSFFEKVKWAAQLFTRIKSLVEMNGRASSKKIFVIDLSKSNQIDILLSRFLSQKIFDKNLGAVVFADK